MDKQSVVNLSLVVARDEEVWPSPALQEKQAPDTSKLVQMSDWNKSGWDEYPEILNPIWEEVNKLYGSDAKPKL